MYLATDDSDRILIRENEIQKSLYSDGNEIKDIYRIKGHIDNFDIGRLEMIRKENISLILPHSSVKIINIISFSKIFTGKEWKIFLILKEI